MSSIRDNKCILLLGPSLHGVKINDRFVSVYEALAKFVSEKLEEIVLEGQEETPNYRYFFHQYIKNRYGGFIQKTLQDDINEYVAQHISEPCWIHQTLAKLPFNTCINLAPDNLLSTALRERGKSFSTGIYTYKGQQEILLTIEQTENEPVSENDMLVYSLIGNFDDPDSLILTEKQQLEYIKNLVARKPALPTNFLTRITNNKSYIFLGFDFNDWYFRIVLDALNLPKPPMSIVSRSPGKDIAILDKTFYSEEFGFHFIDFNTETFVEQLAKEYENKYGPLDQKKKIVMLYDQSDAHHAEQIIGQLEAADFRKRAELTDLSKLEVGEDKVAIEQGMAAADIVIVLMRIEIINNQHLVKLVNDAMNRKETRTICIQTGPGPLNAFPKISKGNNLVLPGNYRSIAANRILGNNADPAAYYLIARKINSTF